MRIGRISGNAVTRFELWAEKDVFGDLVTISRNRLRRLDQRLLSPNDDHQCSSLDYLESV